MEDEEPASASPNTTVHPQPLSLLALLKSVLDLFVWLQLRDVRGVALLSFLRLSQRVPRPFAGARVYDMSLRRAQQLRTVGCGLRGNLVRLLSLGIGRNVQPQMNRCVYQRMQTIAMRVVAGQAAAVVANVAKEAEELGASGQWAAAVVALQLAVDLGHLPSRADLADMLIEGREGVPIDSKRGLVLAEEGVRLGCHHCQGVVAKSQWVHMRESSLPLELARECSQGQQVRAVCVG